MTIKQPKPLLLMILDGWGVSPKKQGNAIAQAGTPRYEQLKMDYPHTTLRASGDDVGLPTGQMGNSEVGHLNMGAGRVVYQELTRISLSVKQGDFFTNPVLLEAVKNAKSKGTALHLMGLLSDGGVHSHIDHLYALLDLAKSHGLDKVYVHAFLDGRDVPPANAEEYIKPLEQKCAALGTGCIATIIGRFYAMDRDKRWERVEKAYHAMVFGDGLKVTTPIDAITQSYARKETDEFVQPTIIIDQGGTPRATVSDGDSVIFFNFRPDRAREITRAFVDDEFQGFTRRAGFPKVHFVCMTQYDQTIPAPIAFKPQSLANTLGEVLAMNNLTQLRIAETEKYAHVTFFFNGGVEPPNPGEDRLLIPSPKVATYDEKPEMSAYEVTDAVLEQIKADKYDVIILNYANPDMVGHTGVMEAAVKAVEAVDQCLGKVVKAVLDKDGVVIITADHGNSEQMKDDEGNPQTAHSTFEVPFILVGNNFKDAKVQPGRLEDVAPTMLKILGIPQPPEMTGKSLIL
ncbi:MAG: 2,3-bisphosphoglycerate-independent phosphoglycerate mutase [Desulfitobacterium hafniense]|nr:2,3-bisphosphoglycerate-independent phosphoglycerate mutase [Desulfitobacterium hafniense]